MPTAWPTGERDKIIARIAAHRAADEIVQGTGFRAGHGCAIGCSLDKYDHSEYARVVLGESSHNLLLAELIDDLHEAQPLTSALDWPGRVAAALQPGADTTLALKRWLHWLLAVELADFPVTQPMAKLFARELAGDPPREYEFATAARAASAASAAWATWDARDASAIRMADALIEIFESLPAGK